MKLKKTRKKPIMVMNCKNDLVELSDFVKELRNSNKIKRLYVLNLRVWINYFEKQRNNPNLFNKNSFLIDQKIKEIFLISECFPKNEWEALRITMRDIKQSAEKTKLAKF